MKCPVCGNEMIWGNDFDYEELGFKSKGITSVYDCKCGVEVEVYCPINKKENGGE